MKKNLLAFLIIPLLLMVISSISIVYAADEYQPTFYTHKSDNMESLTIDDSTPQATRDYIWGNTNLFWVETNNVKETKEAQYLLNGEQSLIWSPGAGDSEGWSAGNVTLGISPSKLLGSEGGYLVKLEFLLKLENVNMLVVKAFDSNDSLRQEVIINSDYQDASDANTKNKDPETSLDIEQLSSASIGNYCKVAFTIRSAVNYTTYYTFTTKAASSEAKVVLDDVVFSRENDPDIPHRDYMQIYNEAFDGKEISETIFTGTSTRVKETTINTENPIMGTSDLKLVPTVRNQRVSLISTPFALKASYHKLYFKYKENLTSRIGVYVKDATTNEIIYDFIVNPLSNERISEKVNPLFDASSFSMNSNNVWTCYGEFEMEVAGNVYLELSFQVTNINGYAIYDDITLLEEYTPSARPTDEDNDPEKIVGVQDAISADIDGGIVKTLKEAFRSDELPQNIFKVVFGLLVVITMTGMIICTVKKKKVRSSKFNLFLLILVVGFTMMITTACSNTDETSIPDGYNVVSPEKISGKLDNPGQGWVMLEESTYGGHVDIGSSGDFPEIDNVSLSTAWAAIELEEGVYDFSLCDKTIDYWTALGKRVNLRICTDNLVLTYTYKGVPDYLFEKYNVNYTYVDYTDPGPIRVCRVIDIRDLNYLRCLDNFLTALYEHYKDNKMVDVVEVRGFGLWGEWHHGWAFDSKADRIASLDNILNHYYQAFNDSGKLLCVSSAWDPDYTSTNEYYTAASGDTLGAYMNYVNWSSFDTAWRLPGMTFRRDSGGALLRYDLDERIMAEAFRSGKRVPLLGEYSTNYYNLTSAGNAFNLMSAVDDILYKMRPNYITCLGWVAVEFAHIISQGDTDFIDRANEMMGYRLAVDTAFVPTKVTNSGEFEVLTAWSNSAVGIFPYDTNLTYHVLDQSNNTICTLEDDTFDARTLVQGEVTNQYSTLKLPSNIANGKYKLAVSINYEGEKIALGMAGEVASGSRIYELSEFEVVDEANTAKVYDAHISYSEATTYNFEKNSTYEITFRYLPQMQMSNFYFGTLDSYKVALVSNSMTGTEKEVGTYYWQDISSEIGTKTITVTTGNSNDYKLKISSINFDKIYVDDVWIRKVSSSFEDFSDYEVTDATTIIEPINVTTAEPVDNGIQGRSLALSSRNTSAQHILAKIDVNNVQFKVGTTYKITFDFRAGGQIGNGGYYFIASGDYNNIRTEFDIFGEWYERDDTYDTKKTFTFTPTTDNQTISFGVNSSGNYYIDNLTITSQDITSNMEGEDLVNARNEVPRWEAGVGITETFEKGAFQASGFEWGQFAWGRMTSNPSEVTSYSEENQTSLLCRIEAEAYDPAIDNVWFEFVRSKLSYFDLEADAYYTVKFEYKIIKAFASGKVFCFFRDDTLADRFAQAINNPYLLTDNESDLTTGKKVGEVYTFEYAFKLGSHDSYQFMICSNGLWEIAVDNILIEKVTEAEAKAINGVS